MKPTYPNQLALLFVLLTLATGCSSQDQSEERNKNRAIAFFRGVYGGDPSVITEFAAEDISLSYPIFQTLFKSPVVVGKEAVMSFAERFSTKWKEPEIIIEEAIADRNVVVMVWSFRARDAFAETSNQSNSDQKKSWGGISIFHFNDAGKILTEYGEESEPGPAERLRSI